jgi:predicted Zn finger-like uncharacterized protein
MALATKCPQCGALFRVVADQLKLRGGLVRCGQCRAVFDAIGSLTYVDDAALAQSRTVSGAARSTAPVSHPPADDSAARQALGPSTTLRIAPVAPATLAGNLPLRIELPKPPPEEPALLRRRTKAAARERTESSDVAGEASSPEDKVPTLVAATRPEGGAAPAPASRDVEAEVAAAGSPSPAAATVVEASADAEPAPTFMRPKRRTSRGFSVVYGGGSALLVLLAIVQLAVIFRGELMVHWPQSRPALVDLCQGFGCSVNWPTQADQLAVIGTELQAIPGTDALELTAVIRNRARFKQALPAVEVTLTDARNRALARKVFTPADYLASAGEPSSRLQEGFGPGSDFTIRLYFEARGLAPAGFLVYPFFL